MYQASTEYNTFISGNSRTFSAKIVSGSDTITSGIKNYKYNGGSNGDDNITIGSTVSAYIEMEISNPGISLENKEIQLLTGLQLSNSVEYIPVGKFTVQKHEKNGNNIKITAYDKMSKADGMPYFSDLTYPATAIQMLDEICTKLGIGRATTGLGTITIPGKLEGYTCREAIGYIAALYGKFAYINRQGNLEIRWYEDNNYNVGPGRYFTLATNESNFTVNKIECSVNSNTTLTVGSGYTGISISDPLMTQDRLNTIYNVLNGFIFRPGSCKFLGDPRLDPWDIVTVTDLYGNICKIPSMVLIQEYDGGISTTVEAKGKTEEECKNDFKGPTTKAIERTYVELMLVKTLLVDKADIETLQANYATISSLTAVSGRIDSLESSQITTNYLTTTYAKIDLTNIAAGTIKTAMIATAAIGTTQIADGSITDAKIVALTANKITSGTIDAAQITVVNLNAANITVGTINGQQIAPGAMDMSKIDTAFNTTIASKINSSQAQSIADITVSNLQIGGRNLLLGTNGSWNLGTDADLNTLFQSNIPSIAPGYTDIFGTKLALRLTPNSANQWIAASKYLNKPCKTPGVYTFSFYVRSDVATTIRIGNRTIGDTVDTLKTINVTTTWTKVFKTFTTTGTLNQHHVWIFTNESVPFETSHWKVESGVKVTDWTLAPEDVDANIVKAQSTADGKNTVFYATTAPTATKTNDVWFNTADSNKISYWNGSTWALSTLGTNALADLSITNAKIADATIQNAKIANLDAAKITTGYLSADRIASSSITAVKIAANTITATQIATGTITANVIASRTITADKIVIGAITANEIAAATITGTKIAANTITASNLSVASLSAITANLGTVTAGILQSANYVSNVSGMKLALSDGTWDSKYFKVSTDGKINATGGTIAGFTISTSGLSSTASETFPIYTTADLDTMKTFILGYATPTEADLVKYDINGDRKVSTLDLVHAKRIQIAAESNITTATLNMNPYSVRNMIELRRTSGSYVDNRTIIGAGNIYTDGLACGNLVANDIECSDTIIAKNGIRFGIYDDFGARTLRGIYIGSFSITGTSSSVWTFLNVNIGRTLSNIPKIVLTQIGLTSVENIAVTNVTTSGFTVAIFGCLNYTSTFEYTAFEIV